MTSIVDTDSYQRTVAHLRDAAVLLPTLSQLAEPETIPESVTRLLSNVDPDAPQPENLFRVHWHNGPDRRSRVPVPEHIVIPPELSGVNAKIVLMVGDRFPMIRAHKVLAAYSCLVPRLVSGEFDATRHRALWPSTGNYCRGGVAISRILGCHGVAILPEGMSAERFQWLDQWVADPADIVRTPGSESNVKEIYDCCDELSKDPAHLVLNQFSEFGNHLGHYLCTGKAFGRVFEKLRAEEPGLELRAFVSATGSAGTIGAGDYLKDEFGAKIVAVEALECPTMLYNGFGEHNIQGIGDKHIPFIHNVMNTDMVTAISDRHTDALDVLFNEECGQRLLVERGIPASLVDRLPDLGFSSLCNLLASIKTAQRLDLGPNDVIFTVATDGADLYVSERESQLESRFAGNFNEAAAENVLEESLQQTTDNHFLELSDVDRNRIFNLGYFTWVEQRGVSLEEFEQRRSQSFWKGLRARLPEWDAAIDEFNAQTGMAQRFGSA